MSSLTKPFMLWMPPSLICVYRCSHGQSSDGPKELSNYTHCWICEARYQHLCPSPMVRSTRSIFLTVLLLRSVLFTIMDRGYLDFGRLFALNQAPAFFIIRAKSNTGLRRLYSMPLEKSSGLQCDQIVMLTGFYSKKDYPEKLRRIRYYDDQHKRRLVFLTNNFSLPALTIADLYRCRWQVELFFKWIKQHLRIKAFYGTTENAVKTQIWIAISVYVLVANYQKAAENRVESLHNFTDFEFDSF